MQQLSGFRFAQVTSLPAASAYTGMVLEHGGGLWLSDGTSWSKIALGGMPPGLIEGLELRWVSGSALTVTSGSAYVEALGRVVDVPSQIAKTSIGFAANTWHHVYLYLNSGTPDVEIVTTAPATPYSGNARSKTGDTTRRYLGSVLTDSAGAIYNFRQNGDRVDWKVQTGVAPFRCLNAGTATAETTVSLAGAIPVTSAHVNIYFQNISSQIAGFGTPDDSAPGSPFSGMIVMDVNARLITLFPTDASRQITYWLVGTPTSGALYADVLGYKFGR